METERYLVRVQLIRSDSGGEYITGSFDYNVSPTTDPSIQDPLFMRAEKFYKQIQSSFKRSGNITVTKKEVLENEFRKGDDAK